MADAEIPKKNGITIDQMHSTWIVAGKTWQHKNALRQLGGSWNSAGKDWEYDSDPTAKITAYLRDPESLADMVKRSKVDWRSIWETPEDQEYKSTQASINKTKNPVTIGLVEKHFGGWESGSINADLGGGMHDNTIQYMQSQGVENVVYDPFNRTDDYNKASVERLKGGKATTATINNTLNVIKEADVRNQLLREAQDSLKPGGTLYIQIYEGDQTGAGRNTKGDIWQENRKTADYLAEIQKVFPDAEIKRGLITAKNTIVATKSGESAVEGDSVVVGLSAAIKEKAYHQKKGMDIWRVRLQGPRTDRETFVELKTAAKKHGGYYSSYKGNGAKPGFVFDEEAQAQAFLGDFQQIMSPGGRSSFSTPKNPGQVAGISTSAVEKAIAPVRLAWQSGPTVEVIANKTDLPKHLREEAGDRLIDGVYDPTTKTAYLVADAIPSARQARVILAHEAVGHHSMEEMLGDEFAEIQQKVQLLKQAKDKRVSEIAAEVRERYGELDPADESAEIIAVMAEKGIRNGLMKRVYAAIRRFLRRFSTQIFTTTELEGMIAKAGSRLGMPGSSDIGKGKKPVFSHPGDSDVSVPARTTRWMGFDSLRLIANYPSLQSRHPEHYSNPAQVKKDVEFVLRKPNDWYPHADGRITIFRQSREGIPSLRIDFRHESDGAYRIVSVYPMGKRSIAKKMGEKKKALSQAGSPDSRISGGRLLPGQLTIADYVTELGDESSQPSSPSRDDLKASDSNIDQNSESSKPRLSRPRPRASEELQRKLPVKTHHFPPTSWASLSFWP
ncbi:MAG: hypothetical protein OI74_11560 [Gammaproteobacteria bacterium (ex Lamellibrachia satsuma)]|nr:MAG: hypothetical protein HPY30_04850 [Gammaproteobacteria bacterium (ex Lamellibrachia satsuma)]RRS32369.1 MAG: hypothetical protein OI74_11560 [Gammaproteobacteria bacterium (ex Lamellibrachia satsuma)]RRS35312.1 MAG: hypothetical protein NV67_11215 [Gammaproteobacteria bacterium (ex Lamellibrachia satsuma)]